MDNDAFKPRWRRKQAEGALWRYFATYQNWGGDNTHSQQPPPKVFSSRVRKLLDLDRGFDRSKLGDAPAAEWAFYDTPGEGTGSKRPLSDFNVFLLAVALDMLNTGLKQSEILFFLRHTRETIKDEYRQIRAQDLPAPVMGASPRAMRAAQDYPSAPSVAFQGSPMADFSVFMLVRRVEMTELVERPQAQSTRDAHMPLYWQPAFAYGLDELTETLYRSPNSYRCVIVLELADMARALPRILADTPRFERGRPKG